MAVGRQLRLLLVLGGVVQAVVYVGQEGWHFGPVYHLRLGLLWTAGSHSGDLWPAAAGVGIAIVVPVRLLPGSVHNNLL